MHSRRNSFRSAIPARSFSDLPEFGKTRSLAARVATGLLLAVAFAHGDAAPEAMLRDLNVVAVDSKGAPVNDLTLADFEVTDAGKHRPISYFRHNTGRLSPPPPLQPGEFANRRGAGAHHPTLLLFDLLNQRFSTRGVTANQIVRELGGLEDANDLYFYLLTLDGRLYAAHGLPESEQTGVRTDATPWTGDIKQIMDRALRSVAQVRSVDIDVNVRVQLTLNALDALAARLSMFPGRKNIVWVTDGVPIALGPQRSDTGDYIDFTPQLRQLSEWCDRSGVAIYPVRQVMLGSPDAMGAAYGSGLGSEETLNELAGLTGGRPTGTKDIAAAVRQAVTDVRSSYQIGYYAPEESMDGKFHKLRVVCKRKGVRIQAKNGYYAFAEAPGARAQRAIGAAVADRFDAAEIGLRGRLSIDPKDRLRARISTRIDASDIALAQESDDRYSGELRIALAGFTADGRTATSSIVPLDVHFTAAGRDKALREGIPFEEDIALGDGVNRVRVVVFDRGSTAIGSLTLPVGDSLGH
ncbi:MAG TPA: VWA domain-containing protein [Bryobacteraceae bacterium]|nr:VWA domain-containing protein [Bryobacteraceae bacterium]